MLSIYKKFILNDIQIYKIYVFGPCELLFEIMQAG